MIQELYPYVSILHTPSGGSNHVGGQAQIAGYPAKVIGFYSLTLPETSETNRAPEKGWLEEYYLSVKAYFQVQYTRHLKAPDQVQGHEKNTELHYHAKWNQYGTLHIITNILRCRN